MRITMLMAFLASCLIFAGASSPVAQAGSSGLAQVIALDEQPDLTVETGKPARAAVIFPSVRRMPVRNPRTPASAGRRA